MLQQYFPHFLRLLLLSDNEKLWAPPPAVLHTPGVQQSFPDQQHFSTAVSVLLDMLVFSFYCNCDVKDKSKIEFNRFTITII
jgi:hypothetical protein